MIRGQYFFRTLSVALALATILVLGLVANVALAGAAVYRMSRWEGQQAGRVSDYAAALQDTAPQEVQEAGYALPDDLSEQLNAAQAFVLLLSPNGEVLWSANKPGDVPERFTLAQVAGFSRWYLNDYPIKVWAMEDGGLTVLGQRKDSVWKYDFEIPMAGLGFWPLWLALTLLCNFLIIFIVGAAMTRRWYQKRDAARTQWIAGVSHDVRTPLSVMLGYASSMEADPALPQATREQAAAIRKNGQQLRGLITDLNLTNRLSHSMEPLRREWVLLPGLLRQTAADFLNDQPDSRYVIEPDIPQSLEGMALYGDPTLLRRALNNLVGNSIGHNPQGCRITLSLARSTLSCAISVSDDGTGYRPEQLAMLNSRKSTPTVENGHGLGLTIVRQIARVHRGKARFANLEKGCICTLTFCRLFCRQKRTAVPEPK